MARARPDRPLSAPSLRWHFVEQQRARKDGSGPRRQPGRRRRDVATDLPIARVCVGVTPIHLDRPFDYEVPETLSNAAQPGCRVRIRFAGRLVDGFVLSREASSDHVGVLAQLERVNGPPVVTAAGLVLARTVADRYVGTLFDVLRMVVPARHARAERTELATPTEPGANAVVTPTDADVTAPMVESGRGPDRVSWDEYEGGGRLLAELGSRTSQPVRATVTLAGADDAAQRLVELVCAAVVQRQAVDARHAGPRGRSGSCLVLVPDARMVASVTSLLVPMFGPQVVRLTADLGPAQRYRTYLRILAGDVCVVVGTRAAVFAPLPDLALTVMWDDGDDTYLEPHSPGWHAREVLAMRSAQEGCDLVYVGFARSVEVCRMVRTGFLRSIAPTRAMARNRRPEVVAVDGVLGDHRGDTDGVPVRIPPKAFEVIRAGLRTGPVLIQVARAGYLPAVSCTGCRARASCPHCHGPLSQRARAASPQCQWCGRIIADYACPKCGGTHLSARAIGAVRTAEELGRAFPGTPVLLSGSEHGVRDTVPAAPALVVSTVGAEPTARGGYAAAVLLDVDRELARPDIRAEEEALRRWLAAVALVRSRGGGAAGGTPGASTDGPAGGIVLLVGNPAARAVQAVLRADPVGWAERELAERREAKLPPAYCLAAVAGEQAATHRLVAPLTTDSRWIVHGPTEVAVRAEVAPGDHRYLIVAARPNAAALAQELRAGLIMISAGGRYRLPSVRIDPISVGWS